MHLYRVEWPWLIHSKHYLKLNCLRIQLTSKQWCLVKVAYTWCVSAFPYSLCFTLHQKKERNCCQVYFPLKIVFALSRLQWKADCITHFIFPHDASSDCSENRYTINFYLWIMYWITDKELALKLDKIQEFVLF